MTNLVLIGRWHAVTRDQEAVLREQIEQLGPERLTFIITAADQWGTRRHPLEVGEREEIVHALGEALRLPFEIHRVADVSDSARWADHVLKTVPLRRSKCQVLTGNAEVTKLFRARGYPVIQAEFRGALPVDVFTAIRSNGDWKRIASPGTVRVYREHHLERRIRELFADVLLTDDGELSTGRDFAVYAHGMDASLGVKITDLCPHIVPGTIVDKGCGTGKLLVHLSELFPTSQIVGMDLSRELLRVAESQHYPNQNVAIVKGNIIRPHFAAGTVSTVIFSSVIHEICSYNGYDRDQVRLALRNTLEELRPGGRVIIRDGPRPPRRRVWMHCDTETEERFRRFAREFKGKSATPGVRFQERRFEGRTWFVLGMHEANEFLSKKDYLENWAVEVNEEFGVFSLPAWRTELQTLGYRVVEARSYLNPWIEKNRYRGRVRLCADMRTRPGPALAYPDTTAVIVGERRPDKE